MSAEGRLCVSGRLSIGRVGRVGFLASATRMARRTSRARGRRPAGASQTRPRVTHAFWLRLAGAAAQLAPQDLPAARKAQLDELGVSPLAAALRDLSEESLKVSAVRFITLGGQGG